MVYRMQLLFVAAVAAALCVRTAALADDPKDNTHEGTVVSVTADTLIMKGVAKDGQEAAEHRHTLADNAKVTCDARQCRLEDLKPGQKIRVTTKKGDKAVAIRIEALDKNERFQKRDGNDAKRNERDRDRR